MAPPQVRVRCPPLVAAWAALSILTGAVCGGHLLSTVSEADIYYNEKGQNTPLRLHCGVTGSYSLGVCTYTWYHNGSLIHPAKAANHRSWYLVNSSASGDIARQITPSGGMLGNEHFRHVAGEYRCLAQCASGGAHTPTVRLIPRRATEYQCPSISNRRHQVKVQVREGETEILHCNAPHATPNNIRWFKDRKKGSTRKPREVLDLDIPGLHFDEVEGRLIIHSATKRHRGKYFCRTSAHENGKAGTGCKIRVEVVERHMADIHPRRLYPTEAAVIRRVRLGHQHSTKLQCIFEARSSDGDHVNITWCRMEENGTCSAVWACRRNSTCHVPTVALGETRYMCVGANQQGVDRGEVVVRMEDTPALLTVPNSTLVTAGRPAVFICRARGYPGPALTWASRLDGMQELRELQAGLREATFTVDTSSLGGVSESIMCTSANEHGLVYVNATLYVAHSTTVPATIPTTTTTTTTTRAPTTMVTTTAPTTTKQTQAADTSSEELTWLPSRPRSPSRRSTLPYLSNHITNPRHEAYTAPQAAHQVLPFVQNVTLVHVQFVVIGFLMCVVCVFLIWLVMEKRRNTRLTRTHRRANYTDSEPPASQRLLNESSV